MNPLFLMSCFFIAAAGTLCAVRLILGPGLADRVVAIDLLTNVLMAAIALFSLYQKQPIYLDIVVVFALVMFLNSSMFARYIEKK